MNGGEDRNVIPISDHRWIELGSADMDLELANAYNELLARVNRIEERLMIAVLAAFVVGIVLGVGGTVFIAAVMAAGSRSDTRWR